MLGAVHSAFSQEEIPKPSLGGPPLPEAVLPPFSGTYGQPGYAADVPGLEAAYAGPRLRPPPIFVPNRAYRYGSVYRGFGAWPFVPGGVYRYVAPFIGRVPQPLGRKVITAGPSDYLYRPAHGSDPEPQRTPTLAPQPAPELSPAQPQAEAAPSPPDDAGPREF